LEHHTLELRGHAAAAPSPRSVSAAPSRSAEGQRTYSSGGAIEGIDDSAGPVPALERTRLVAELLDDAIPIPLVDRRIGLDPLIGLLPGAGDAVAGAISLYIVAEALVAGVPASTLSRILLHVLVDVAIGAIPIVGDVFDALWKANRRNVSLLAEHFDAAGE
jgi:hypothetical protein